MVLNIDGISIGYERHFGFGPTIILLHGWGVSGKIFNGVFDYFASAGMNIISIDFPGFGDSGKPPTEWGIYDFAAHIDKFISELSLEEVILVGHSFGGRVAVILASLYGYVKKTVLVSAAGIKPKFSLKKALAVWKYKIAKRRGKNLENFGSEDYKSLSDDMKPIFVRVVNEHLEKLMKNINCPTLIIWGENDNQTPLYMAHKIHSSIKNSELQVFAGCGHFSFLERTERFNIVVDNFIRS